VADIGYGSAPDQSTDDPSTNSEVQVRREAKTDREWHRSSATNDLQVPRGINTVVPMREAEGTGKNRAECMRQFRAAWDRFGADRAMLT
jgi:hypothetical protein